MTLRLLPRAALVALSVTALTGVAVSCSDSNDKPIASTTAVESSTSAAPGGQVVAPVMVDLAGANGTTVTVPLGNVVVLGTDTPAAWTATIADPTVASFTAGGSDGSATFNPGLTPLAAGTTEVTVTDGTTTVTFTLTVTA